MVASPDVLDAAPVTYRTDSSRDADSLIATILLDVDGVGEIKER